MFRRRESSHTFDLASATESALAVLQQKDKPASRYPFTSAVHSGLKQGSVGVHDRWIVALRESVIGVIRASMHDIESRRDTEITFDARSEAEISQGIDAWYDKIVWWRDRLSVYRLEENKQYTVLQDFTDYYNNAFQAGQKLTYVKQNFLPYEGGYTVSFQQATLYLQENVNSNILNNFDLYLSE